MRLPAMLWQLQKWLDVEIFRGNEAGDAARSFRLQAAPIR